MRTPATIANILRTQGLQFARLFQGALRLVMLYSAEHTQSKAMIERAFQVVDGLLKEVSTLSLGFQFDRVVLNSLPVGDPSLAPLASELAKRRVGFLVFTEGLDEAGLARMLGVLGTKPEVIEEKGGLVRFLRSNPLEHTRIVPVQVAAAEGSLAVVTSAEEAASIARIPRWLLRALHEVQASGAIQIVGPQELADLAASLAPELTPEQRMLLPQLQDLLLRVVQKANTAALAELIHSATIEVGAAAHDLLKNVLLQGLAATAKEGELPQAERILRSLPALGVEPKELLEIIPQEEVAEEVRQGLTDYVLWLQRPLEDRVADLGTRATGREFRWMVLETEQLLQQGNQAEAANLLLTIFSVRGPKQETERAEALTRARYLLTDFCAGGLPTKAEEFLEAISNRLREEVAAPAVVPLVESLGVLAQVAAEREEFPLAIAAASVIAEMGEELTPRGRAARDAQGRLLKPSTLAKLVKTCLLKKQDPDVNRLILPLLKRAGDQTARELLVLLEREQVASRRLRILQLLKMLGKSAAEAIAEKISDQRWYVVRNAVTALAEIGDPSLLDRLEPALSHQDERVQQAAVTAMIKTRSPLRGPALARALPLLKPAPVETVLDDLLVLREPKAAPYLESLIRQSGEKVRPALVDKAIAILAAINSEDAVYSLVDCVEDAAVKWPQRRAAVHALRQMSLPAAREALVDLASSSDENVAAEVRARLQS